MSVFPVVRGSYLTYQVILSKLCPCVHHSLLLLSSRHPSDSSAKEFDPNTGELRRKKTSIIPKITLISGDSMQICTLTEAENLSKRRNLKLIKIVDIDAKSQRPLYKLMTGSEFHAEDLKQRELRKRERDSTYIRGEKVLLISSKISKHDLDIHLKKTHKWLQKMYEVRVVITGGNIEALEKLYTSFEEFHQQTDAPGKLVQKRLSGSEIKFQILPTRTASSGANKDDSANDGHKKNAL